MYVHCPLKSCILKNYYCFCINLVNLSFMLFFTTMHSFLVREVIAEQQAKSWQSLLNSPQVQKKYMIWLYPQTTVRYWNMSFSFLKWMGNFSPCIWKGVFPPSPYPLAVILTATTTQFGYMVYCTCPSCIRGISLASFQEMNFPSRVTEL